MPAPERYTPEELMQIALREAEHGRGRTRPNPVVGCVIARDGELIATGFHARAGLAHAEVAALRVAGERARGADAYVTLEPCNHTGRTGPCTDALVAAGVARVFVGALDPNPLVHGKGVRCLRRYGIHVEVGLLGERARVQNEAFAHYMQHRRPFVVVKLAESLDGRVATRTRDSKWITSAAARREGHRLRDEADAVIVGAGTVLADDPSLTCRIRGGRDPIRVVVDTRARTPVNARIVRLARSSAAPTWIAVGKGAATRRVRALERAGAEVLRLPERGGRVDVARLLDELGRRELLSVLVEGGPALVGEVFDRRLADKVHAFIAPRVIGGAAALGAVGGKGPDTLARSHALAHVEVRRAGPDLWVTGYPR